jgi:hypothetical protein
MSMQKRAWRTGFRDIRPIKATSSPTRRFSGSNCNRLTHLSCIPASTTSQSAASSRSKEQQHSVWERSNRLRACFSDSHALAALGKNAKGQRRLTRIKMDGPSFGGLRVEDQFAPQRITQ